MNASLASLLPFFLLPFHSRRTHKQLLKHTLGNTFPSSSLTVPLLFRAGMDRHGPRRHCHSPASLEGHNKPNLIQPASMQVPKPTSRSHIGGIEPGSQVFFLCTARMPLKERGLWNRTGTKGLCLRAREKNLQRLYCSVTSTQLDISLDKERWGKRDWGEQRRRKIKFFLMFIGTDCSWFSLKLKEAFSTCPWRASDGLCSASVDFLPAKSQILWDILTSQSKIISVSEFV